MLVADLCSFYEFQLYRAYCQPLLNRRKNEVCRYGCAKDVIDPGYCDAVADLIGPHVFVDLVIDQHSSFVQASFNLPAPSL